MKFSVICESCRHVVSYRTSTQEERQLIRSLALTFNCSNCHQPVQVSMMDDGSVVSVSIPGANSGSQSAISASGSQIPLASSDFRPAPDAGKKPATSVERAVPSLPQGVTPESDRTAHRPSFLPQEVSVPGTERVPFSPLPDSASRSGRPGAWQRFSDWFNNLSPAGQWGIIVPLIGLAILVLLWEPGGTKKYGAKDSTVQQQLGDQPANPADATSNTPTSSSGESTAVRPPVNESTSDVKSTDDIKPTHESDDSTDAEHHSVAPGEFDE